MGNVKCKQRETLYNYTNILSSVSNSTFTSDNGAEIRNVCGITLDNVVLNHRNGRRIVLENATGFNER